MANIALRRWKKAIMAIIDDCANLQLLFYGTI
jgi:hypothetical protein